MNIEIPKDLKYWYALSCPTKGLRFDRRTLELLDTNGDGHIRSDEVQAALDYLRSKGVSIEDLNSPKKEDSVALEEVVGRIAALDSREPTEVEKAALATWEAEGKKPGVAVCGNGTEAAEAALADVEPIIDAFFATPDDMPLVTEAPDPVLPFDSHLNPKHQEAILGFAELCVKPVLGDGKLSLTRVDYKAVKAAFAPYRAWKAAKPVMSADVKSSLEDQERLLRYKLFLGEFLDNYVTMGRLYGGRELAVFQLGVLRIDGKELNLCFHVESEAAHSALVGKSKCCVIYLKLTTPADGSERTICAVVTAGTVAGLYVGRNGVFYDRDGKIWEAVVTKVVEAQVSLAEAFWAPWRKLGEGIAAAVKKFLGDKQDKAVAGVQKGTESAQAGGAAMASSIAAIGIGVGMAGAAVASLAAVVKGMGPLQLVGSVVALILVVSMPSVILAWFKLRKRDLGAILNAGGWAVNREMRFSMKRAALFTKCKKTSVWWFYILVAVIVLGLGGWLWWSHSHQKNECCQVTVTQEAK